MQLTFRATVNEKEGEGNEEIINWDGYWASALTPTCQARPSFMWALTIPNGDLDIDPVSLASWSQSWGQCTRKVSKLSSPCCKLHLAS